MIVRYFKYINNVLRWHLSTERDPQKGAFQDKVETQVFFIYLFIFFFPPTTSENEKLIKLIRPGI